MSILTFEDLIIPYFPACISGALATLVCRIFIDRIHREKVTRFLGQNLGEVLDGMATLIIQSDVAYLMAIPHNAGTFTK